MNRIGSTSSSSSSSTPAAKETPFVVSEERRDTLKALYADLVKVREGGGDGEALLRTLTFVLENGEVVVADHPVMTRYCSKIDPGIDSMDLPQVNKEAVEYFIKTVYQREEAIATIPLPLFKDVVDLAFTVNALDWEDHLCISMENLDTIVELITDSRSPEGKRKAAEYVRNYYRSVPGLLNGLAALGGSSEGSRRSSTTSHRSSRARSPSSSRDRRDRSRTRSLPRNSAGGGRSSSKDKGSLSTHGEEASNDANASTSLNTKKKNSNHNDLRKSVNNNDGGHGQLNGSHNRMPEIAPRKRGRKPKPKGPTNDNNASDESLGPPKPKRRGRSISSQAHVAAGTELSMKLMNAKPGEIINISPGTYEVKKLVLNLPPGVRILGSDAEKTIIRGAPGSTIIWEIQSRNGAGKDVVIENLTFQMDGVFGSKEDRSGLVLFAPGASVQGCTFQSCCLTFGKFSEGTVCQDSKFLNSQWGIYFYDGSRNAQVKNCRFEKVRYGVEIWGNEHKLDGLKFKNVEAGILIRGDKKGILPKEDALVIGRGNLVSNVTYHFWAQDVEQIGIQILAAQGNVLTNINCLNYRRGAGGGGGAQKVGLQILNENERDSQTVVSVARNNSVKGFMGGSVEVEGENNRFEKVEDCPYFWLKGDPSSIIDDKTGIQELVVVGDGDVDGQEVVVPKVEELSISL